MPFAYSNCQCYAKYSSIIHLGQPSQKTYVADLDGFQDDYVGHTVLDGCVWGILYYCFLVAETVTDVCGNLDVPRNLDSILLKSKGKWFLLENEELMQWIQSILHILHYDTNKKSVPRPVSSY